jgi:hypothetical protein
VARLRAIGPRIHLADCSAKQGGARSDQGCKVHAAKDRATLGSGKKTQGTSKRARVGETVCKGNSRVSSGCAGYPCEKALGDGDGRRGR